VFSDGTSASPLAPLTSQRAWAVTLSRATMNGRTPERASVDAPVANTTVPDVARLSTAE
jgi:hypothetical protein